MSDKLKNTLIAGPWVGEFGWELFAWQAYIRRLSYHFDKTIIISREKSKALYEDFATQFIAHNPYGGMADSFFMYNVDTQACFREIVKQNKIVLDKNTTLLLPRRIGIPPHTHYSHEIPFGKFSIAPEYVCFGVEIEKEYDYVFHIRNRKLREQDNWSLENWSKLLELLGDKKIACIGTKESSGIVDGADDLRGSDLKKVTTVLRNATCAFGPSSGPMHLASLCACPHVVWSTKKNKIRYEENWNPLKTPVLFLGEYEWHPTAEYVYNKFSSWEK